MGDKKKVLTFIKRKLKTSIRVGIRISSSNGNKVILHQNTMCKNAYVLTKKHITHDNVEYENV